MVAYPVPIHVFNLERLTDKVFESADRFEYGHTISTSAAKVIDDRFTGNARP